MEFYFNEYSEYVYISQRVFNVTVWLMLKEDLFVSINDIGGISQGHFLTKKHCSLEKNGLFLIGK